VFVCARLPVSWALSLSGLDPSLSAKHLVHRFRVFEVPARHKAGAGFCNFRAMQWNTDKPLSQPLLQEQRSRESSKVGREEEGLSSNRPELVAL
jgi:hypothetical protein